MSLNLKQNIVTNDVVVSSVNNNNFHCHVCNVEISYNDLTKHTTSPRHMYAIDAFSAIYKTNNDELFCQICMKQLDLNDLKSHGDRHMAVPWHRSCENNKEITKYFVLFNNYIIEWNNIYCCCVCSKNFIDISNAFVHITDPNHQIIKGNVTNQLDQLHLQIGGSMTYESLVTEGLIAGSENTSFKCVICGSDDIKFQAIARHVEGLLHVMKKLQFSLEIPENVSQDRFAAQGFVKVAGNDDDKLIEAEEIHSTSWCLICKIEISNNLIKVHVEGNEHIKNLVRYGCNNISQRNDIALHLSNSYFSSKIPDNHRQDLPAVRGFENLPEDHDNAVGKEEISSLDIGKAKCDFISTEKVSTAWCVICQIEIQDDLMKFHVEDEQHKKKLGLRDSNFISQKNDIALHIPKKVKFALEISKEIRQEFSTVREYENISEYDNNTVPNETKEISPSPEIGKVPKCDFILSYTDDTSWCVICKIQISKCSMNVHVEDEEHKKNFVRYGCDYISQKNNVEYYCTKCECTISGLIKIGLHVTEKHHMLKKVPKNRNIENKNKGNESCTMKDCTYIVKTSEDSYICVVCDINLLDVSEHLKNIEHISALERHGCDNISMINDHEYHCKRCDCSMSGIYNVYEHLKGKRHINKSLKPKSYENRIVENICKRTMISDSNEDNFISYREAVCNYIRHLDADICFCVVCGYRLLDYNVNAHLKGKEHIESLKRFGCEDITMVEENKYYCKYCDISIQCLYNLYDHVVGKRHVKRVKAVTTNQENNKQSTETETSGGPALPDCNSFDQVSKTPEVLRIPEVLTTGHSNSPLYQVPKIPTTPYPVLKSSPEIDKNPFRQASRTLEKSISKTAEVVAKPTYNLFPNCYIVKKNERYYHCVVCNYDFAQTITNFVNHAAEKSHVEALMKHGCNNITLLEAESSYYCECCRVVIYDLDALRWHVKDKNHCTNSTRKVQLP